MPFRSHVARSVSLRHRATAIIFGLAAVAGATAVVLWLDGAPATVLWAPVHAFVAWALMREIDPDHQWSAFLGALGAAAWVLSGEPPASLLVTGGLIGAGRLVVRSTGRRPLVTDIIVLGLFGVAIGYTVEGWIAGFGLAVAIYVDGRLGEDTPTPNVPASAVTAVGVTVVAAVFDAFPRAPLEFSPVPATAAGLTALAMILRDPADPVSVVDARHRSLIDGRRLHLARSSTAILVFAMTLLAGANTDALLPLVFMLAVAVASNELELIRRRDR